MNNYYDSIFTTESLTLPNLDASDIPDMLSIVIDIDGVTKLLQGVNPSKASGSDSHVTYKSLEDSCPGNSIVPEPYLLAIN